MPLSLNVEDFSEQLQHFMFLMVMKKNESLVSFAQNKHRDILRVFTVADLSFLSKLSGNFFPLHTRRSKTSVPY